jgi:hypothetical protein
MMMVQTARKVVDVVYLERIGWNSHGCAGRGVAILPLRDDLGVVLWVYSCKTCGLDFPCYKDGNEINRGDVVSVLGGGLYDVISTVSCDRDSRGNIISSKWGFTDPCYEDLSYIGRVNVSDDFSFNFEGKHYRVKRVGWESFEVAVS